MFHRLLIQPVGHLVDGAVGIVGNLSGRDGAALMMSEGVEMHEVVVLAEDIRVALEVADAWVIATVAECGAHDVVLPLPGSCRRVAHGIAEGLWTAGAGEGAVVVSIALIKPRAFLVVLDMRQLGHLAL